MQSGMGTYSSLAFLHDGALLRGPDGDFVAVIVPHQACYLGGGGGVEGESGLRPALDPSHPCPQHHLVNELFISLFDFHTHIGSLVLKWAWCSWLIIDLKRI